MACMIAAVASSAFFLTGYIIYHANVGEKSSGFTGWNLRPVYFAMLTSHVLLAFVTLPLVIIDARSRCFAAVGIATGVSRVGRSQSGSMSQSQVRARILVLYKVVSVSVTANLALGH